MDRKVIDYMLNNPTEEQKGCIKELYDLILRESAIVSDFKKYESDKLKNAYISRDKAKAVEILEFSSALDAESTNLEEISKLIKSFVASNTDTDVEEEQFPQNIVEKVYVWVTDGKICPKCNYGFLDHYVNYIKTDTMQNSRVRWHRCPVCDRLFCLDDEIEDFNVENTNIELNYEHYLKRKITFQDVIVLSNVVSCQSKDHELVDVIARVPIFLEDDIVFKDINISYCKDCKQYIMLKNEFKAIEGIVACQVIDNTTSKKNFGDSEIEIKQRESILYRYGYNVKTKENLSNKQRHMILASVVESNIMTRQEICSHLTTLIERGSKIKEWDLATQKWRQDYHFVKKYNVKNLPEILLNKVILKYSEQK